MLVCFLIYIFIIYFFNFFIFENILYLKSVDWLCKYVIVFIFGFVDYVVNIEDRIIIRVIDVVVDRNKLRKVNRFVVVYVLDII